jgi:AcrR family transcriptional regulator
MTSFNSREDIVLKALELFSEFGYEGTSIRMIASKANISLGLMYNYFSGKDELLKEIFNQGIQDIQHSFDQENAADGKILRIERHIRQTFAIVKEKKLFWRMLHSIRMQARVQEILGKEMKEIGIYIIGQIRENLSELNIHDVENEAHLLFATIDGIVGMYVFDDQYPLQEVETLLIEKYKNLK